MASTTWVSELPSSAAARCADARSVWSILIVRCGRRPVALATRRCGNGGGGSQVTHVFAQLGRSPATDPGLHRLPADAERVGERAQRPARFVQRGQRRGQQLAAPAGAELAQPCGDPLGQHQLGGGPGIRRDLRAGRVRVVRRAARACTYWRSPCVTTSDMVRPSRARRALSRCLAPGPAGRSAAAAGPLIPGARSPEAGGNLLGLRSSIAAARAASRTGPASMAITACSACDQVEVPARLGGAPPPAPAEQPAHDRAHLGRRPGGRRRPTR